MANLALHPGLGPTQDDFDNNTVLTAVNPEVFAGYAHGPIPDNNPGWKPIAYHTAMAAGIRKYDIKAADIMANPPPNQALVLNKENIGVCDILVNPPRQMCGMVLPDGPSMRRHIRQEHAGALVMPDRRAKRREDIISAHNAIKRWILQLGWQNASYVHEPGRGSDNGLVGFWCDALERIAANNAKFRATYGSRFHRFQVPSTPTSGHRSRRRGPDVPANPIPFPGFGPTTAASNGGNMGSVIEDDESDDPDFVGDNTEDDEDSEDDDSESDGDDVEGGDGDVSSSSAFESVA
ncbi:hypothetical protein N7522_000429 [Penicillium canescens]|nr:hypothetical protein N7522_001999 [Penicillium canescens]KAJ6020323.1 hypothetical protein N7522_000398 [Penicillium canescens]KAJ6020354.1 hypothetical protein N7522_000429 [Penicillium canescens]KAJ6174703.1 hypothetical protein N7485_005147 [Penicillium canescens]KAJ6175124.1 hypothetical protein N7485_004929 [Penicillium canescens]